MPTAINTTKDKSLVLYTAATANGTRVSIFLEELRAAYGLEYIVHPIDFSKKTQKEPWFIALNPNGSIPLLVDDGVPVFESAAILLHLAREYDTRGTFSFDARDPAQARDWSEMLQWLFFVHGGIAPMAKASYFMKSAPEDIPYAKKRFVDETKRLYGVLQIRLAERDWLAGPGRGTYTIADMNAFSLVNTHAFCGVETLDDWPLVKAWVERIKARPSVKAGLAVP